MKELTDIQQIQDFIQQNQMSFLFISSPSCSVCDALLPKVQQMLEAYPAVILGHADMTQAGEVGAEYHVFTAPTLLFFVDGKEYIREDRFVSMEELTERVAKIYEMAQ